MESDSSGILRNKHVSGFLIGLIIFTGVTVGFAQYIDEVSKSVVLNDNGDVVELRTMENTVDDVLRRYNIELGPCDKIEPSRDTELEKHNEIKIMRATAATVKADNNIKTVYLTEGTVEDVLKEADITIDDDDIISHSLDTPLTPGLFININRIEKEIITEKTTIPFKEVVKNNAKLEKGKKKVVQEGEEGEIEKKIMVVYKDGDEISRELVEKNTVKEAKNKIIENGTMEKVVEKPKKNITVASRGGSRSSRSSNTSKSNSSSNTSKSNSSNSQGKVASFTATAYTHTGNNTATGVAPAPGMIAVDPNVIPLRTKVYVEFPGMEHLNGYYRAMDTGGAIKGNKIDVFLNTKNQCRQFGVRSVKIYFNK